MPLPHRPWAVLAHFGIILTLLCSPEVAAVPSQQRPGLSHAPGPCLLPSAMVVPVRGLALPFPAQLNFTSCHIHHIKKKIYICHIYDIGGRDSSLDGDLLGYRGSDSPMGRDGCEKASLGERGRKPSLNSCCPEKSHFPKFGVSAPMASGCQRTASAL